MADCLISASVFEVDGTTPKAGVKLVIRQVIVDGVLISTKDQTVNDSTEAPGVLGFTLPQGAVAYLEGAIEGFDRTGGAAVAVPAAATADLEDLAPSSLVTLSGVSVGQLSTIQTALAAHTATKASALTLGHVRIGSGLSIDGDGIVSASGASVTDEAVQDALASFFPDAAPFDWTYDDAGNRVTLDIAVAGAQKGLMSAADKTKLDGVASGATLNSADAVLLARANHTGTQLSSTISDFTSAVDARITNAAILAAIGFTPLNPANNLSEVTPATARTNLGLGTGNAPTFAALILPSASAGLTIYNTADQVTNFEAAKFEWSSNVFRLNLDKGGTGSYRNFALRLAGFNALVLDASLATFGTGAWIQGTLTLGSGLDNSLVRHAAGVIRVGNAGSAAGQLLIGPSATTIDGQLHVVSASGARKGLVISSAASPSANILEMQVNGAAATSFDKGGAWAPASMADAAAPNGSVYYSTTQGKLVFKDSGGVVNNLY